MSADTPVFELLDLRFRYPGAPSDVLDLPRLQLARGQRLLLMGGSGCGKSTLLSLVAGVLLASAGRVRLLGQDWQSMRAGVRDERRVDHVGYVFQQFNLLPYLSVLDNVMLPCRFSAVRRQRALASHGKELGAAQALLQALDLESGLWRRDAASLSVGQQQRVAVARALIGQPELVIADEPTSALDEDRRDAFMQLLGGECARSGCALLFVSHDRRLAGHFDQMLDLPALNRAARAGEAT
ncbi:MAG: ABC transporter ATP-binding protein [Limnohabitans sp.]